MTTELTGRAAHRADITARATPRWRRWASMPLSSTGWSIPSTATSPAPGAWSRLRRPAFRPLAHAYGQDESLLELGCLQDRCLWWQAGACASRRRRHGRTPLPAMAAAVFRHALRNRRFGRGTRWFMASAERIARVWCCRSSTTRPSTTRGCAPLPDCSLRGTRPLRKKTQTWSGCRTISGTFALARRGWPL